MEEPVIRPAGPQDLAAVLAVHSRKEPGVGVGAPSELEERAWARMMRAGGLTVYLAELGGEPVGTATLMVMPNITYGCAPTAFVEAVVVAFDHRRKGIAGALLRRLLRDARAEGCRRIQLLSHKRHAEDGAHRLSTSASFAPEAEGFRRYLRDTPTPPR